jgi:hypothetical protein
MSGDLKKLLTMAFLLLALAGCQQTIIKSTLVIKSGESSDEIRSKIKQSVYKWSEDLGGSCYLNRRNDGEYHGCTVVVDRNSYFLSFWFGADGQDHISTEYTYLHFLPAPKDRVLSGRYVPERHKMHEAWIKKLVPEQSIEGAYRMYIGYDDYKEPF